jgi:hypothetical protein
VNHGHQRREEVQVKGLCNIFHKIIENFPNIEKDMPIQVQEASKTPNRHDGNITSPWNIIVKIVSTEYKERILKVIKKEKSNNI